MDARENWSRSKEVLGAYLRQGAHELGAALYGPGTVAQHPELGMIATRPPALVTDGLRAESEPSSSSKHDTLPSVLQDRIAHAEREQLSPEPEREPERD